MGLPTKVYDAWASVVNYKEERTSFNRVGLTTGYNWVPDKHIRRLQAYEIYQAYYDCYSRDYRQSPESGDSGNNDIIKEIKRPSWICDKIKDKLMGGDVSLNIPVPKKYGREDVLTSLISSETDPDRKKIFEDRLKNLLETKTIISERESYLQHWFSDEMIYLRMDEGEGKCSYLGDIVFVVHWDEKTATVKITTEDPGSYFPNLDIFEESWDEKSKIPVTDRVIIAWEEATNDDQYFKVWRDVYELRKINETESQCYRQSAYFKYSAGGVQSIENFVAADLWNDYQSLDWVGLPFDFIPVVLVPNLAMEGEIYGKSNLFGLLPIFDSLMNADTDISRNSEHLGGATAFISGTEAKLRKNSSTLLPNDIKIEPNSVYVLGENGRVDLLDTSKMQDALIKTKEVWATDLVDLSEITTVIAGRVDPSAIPSGVALRVLMQPLLDKIGKMRQHRQQHYSLLFYYVQRLFAIYGNPEEKVLFGGKIFDAYIQFGEIIPSDEKSKLETYAALMDLLDEETVLEIMKNNGYKFDVKTVMDRRAAKRKEQNDLNSDFFSMRRAQDEAGI